jgi:surface antigen
LVALIALLSVAIAAGVTNPYLGGGCTEWAWKRWNDVNGTSLPSNLGNAKDWAANAGAQGYSVGSSARANSIAVFPPGTNYKATDFPRYTFGHVAFVEVVYSNGTFKTSNYWNPSSTSPNYVTFYPDSRIRFIYPPTAPAPKPAPPVVTVDDKSSAFKRYGPSGYWLRYGIGYKSQMYATWNNGPCSYGASVCPSGKDVNYATWRPSIPSTPRAPATRSLTPEEHQPLY